MNATSGMMALGTGGFGGGLHSRNQSRGISRLRLFARRIVAAIVFLLALASWSHAQERGMQRVIVTLEYGSDVRDFFNALQGYEYNLVDAPVGTNMLILDVSDRTMRRLRTLDMVAGVQQDRPDPIPEHPGPGFPGMPGPDQHRPGAPRPSEFKTFYVNIAGNVRFNDAVDQIRRELRRVPHEIVEVDRQSRRMVVRISERDMPVIGVLDIVQSVVQAQGGGLRPEEQQRLTQVIVQYSSRNHRAEERRILAALDGLPHVIGRRMPESRMIVLRVDRGGLRRLRGLDGITVHMDGLDSPQN